MSSPFLEREWRLFVLFAVEHVRTWDIDPAYPLLRKVFSKKGYTFDESFDHLSRFVAFYRLDSAELYRGGETISVRKQTERRGFRGNDSAAVFLDDMRKIENNLIAISNSEALTPEGRWASLREVLELSVKFCGSWASFKLCDLYKNVLGWDITAPDFGIGGNGKSAGPIPGMMRLTGEDWEVCARDVQLQKSLYDKALTAGVPFNGMEMMETSLCDFNSFRKGKYYVGHDIDSQMEQILGLGGEYWGARLEIFPVEHLGEIGGWFGVRK